MTFLKYSRLIASSSFAVARGGPGDAVGDGISEEDEDIDVRISDEVFSGRDVQ
jgi:hypothetical protein